MLLVTALMAAYLGKVVFLEKPSVYELAKECMTMLMPVIVCQIFVRAERLVPHLPQFART